MNRGLKRSLVFVAAIAFLILGALGLILPFLQGILFLSIGVILLSLVSRTFRSYVEAHTRRYPKTHAFVEKMYQRIEKIVGKIHHDQ